MWVSRRQYLACVTGSSLLLAGCSGGDSASRGGYGGNTEGGATTETTASGGDSAGTTVTMKNTTFNPVRASVSSGTTVTWVNEDSFGHDVTSAQFHDEAASWDFSKSVSPDGSVSHTFESSGIYEYYCTIHGKSQMCGVVLVGDVALEKSLPCESGGSGGGTY